MPRNGVSAWLMSPTDGSEAFGLPRPMVAAQAISTAAMTSWVITAPTAVSQRAAAKCSGRSLLSAIADCW